MADQEEVRARLIRLIGQRGKRRSEWTKERPTEWRPQEVFDPASGAFMHALRAWDEEQDFRELARADREIASRVDLDAVFDETAYTRHLDTIFERLRVLVRKEETVHA